MTKTSGRSSVLSSGTVLTALISAVAAVLTAVLPGLLGTHEQPRAANERPAEPMIAPGFAQPSQYLAPTGAAPVSIKPMPNLTYGTWTIVNSLDDAGTDFSGSTLKFISQRAVVGGLEAIGVFEWRKGEQIAGFEHVVANFDASSRQLFIEGKYVENTSGNLAVGSYSAHVSDDGRELVAGTWGNTTGNQGGIWGKWQARR